MKKILRIVAAALLIALGLWLYRVLFPTDETRIRKLLAEVAETASLKPNENPLVRLGAAGKLAGFFSGDAIIHVDVEGVRDRTIQGRDELQQVVAAARASLQSAAIRFPDVSLTVEPDGLSAVANVAAVADVNGEKNTVVQELKMNLKKIEGKWRISQVDTVRTLSM